MSTVLPWMFASVGAGALLVALLALWQSLRAAFGVTSMQDTSELVPSEQRANLLDEKHALLRSIKDLELEHELGKLSDSDYERLDRELRERVREVMKLLDHDLGPYRKRAEKLLADRLAKESTPSPYREPATQAPEPLAARTGRTLRCTSCDTENDADATFCKSCGTRIAPAEPGGSRTSAEKSSAQRETGAEDEGTGGSASEGDDG